MQTLKPRYGHCAGAYSLSPGLTEVVIFGGLDSDRHVLANTVIMRFGELSRGKVVTVATVGRKCIETFKELVAINFSDITAFTVQHTLDPHFVGSGPSATRVRIEILRQTFHDHICILVILVLGLMS